MNTPSKRHGLRTLPLPSAEPTGSALANHLLAGRKTATVRPLQGPDGHPVPAVGPGQRMLVTDHAGRSVAVVQLTSTEVTTFSAVDAATRLADDPDRGGQADWMAARRQEWLATGLTAEDAAPVLCVYFHVVGLQPYSDNQPVNSEEER